MINLKNDKIHIFFGGVGGVNNNEFNHQKIIFRYIQQSHSDIIVESSKALQQADAHYTSTPYEALLIKTADCMPIMLYCNETKRIAAIHAGWRGIENKIIEKTLYRFMTTGSVKKDFRFWVGPHISQQSFDVDQDVYMRLCQSHYGLKPKEFAIIKNEKYFIDLKIILKTQIQQVLGSRPNIVFYDMDTKTDNNYYSYRREPDSKERNLSFIYLLK